MNDGLISQLVTDMEFLISQSILIGGIGPRPVNRVSNKEYRGSIKKGKKISPHITEVNELISSGTLVSLENYHKVGFLDESLFIDGVDHEWCWRAKKNARLRFFISEKAFLSHQLGMGDRFFIFRNVAISTPFRTYYQFRNFFILIRRNYVPLYWKLSNGLKYFIKFFYFPLVIKPRDEYFKMITRGIKDGIIFKMRE
jgi:rhamnosyltransferase